VTTYLQTGKTGKGIVILPKGFTYQGRKISLDVESGAPLSVRAVVGNREDPQERLELLKKYYPDAKGFSESDNMKKIAKEFGYGEDNFIYTIKDNEGNETQTLYNPIGLDEGDTASMGRAIAETIGGVVGTVASLPSVAVSGPIGPIIGAGLGAEGGGQIYDRVMDYLAKEYVSRGSFSEELIDSMLRVGVNITAPEFVQQVTKRIPNPFKGGARLLTGVTNKIAEQSRKTLKKAEKLGIDIPTLGQLSDSNFARFVTTKLKSFPQTVDQYVQKQEEFINSLAEATADLAKKFGSPQREGGKIGFALQKEALNALEKFRVRQTTLFTEASKSLPPGVKTQLPSLQSLVDDINKEVDEGVDPDIVKAVLKRAKSYLDFAKKNDGMSVDALLKNRTINLQIAKSANAGTETVGINKANVKYLKDINKALYEDMINLFENAGGEKAVKAYRKAQNYTRLNQNLNIDEALNPIVDKNADQAFKFVLAGTKESSERLNKVYRSISKEGQQDLSASLVDRMGYTKPGGSEIDSWNPNTFLRNFDNLSTSVKDTIFKDKKLKGQLDDLVDVLKQAKKMNNFENPSGSGANIVGITSLAAPLLGAYSSVTTGSLTGIGLAGTAFLTPYSMRYLMTNKNFMNWLISSGKEVIDNPRSLSKHLSRLGASIVEKEVDPEYKEAVGDYINQLLFQMNNNQESKVEEEQDKQVAQAVKETPQQPVGNVQVTQPNINITPPTTQAPPPQMMASLPDQKSVGGGGITSVGKKEQFGGLFPTDDLGKLIASRKA